MKLFKYSLINLALMPLLFMLFSPLTASAAPSTLWANAPTDGGQCGATYINSSQQKVAEPGNPDYSNSFLGLVPWYQYINKSKHFSVTDDINDGTAYCGFHASLTIKCSTETPAPTLPDGQVYNCSPKEIINETVLGVSQPELNVVWLIGLAIFEDLLRIAGLAAVIFVIYGGIRYTTSQGSPEQTGAALGTILHALVGLAVAIIAATSISFIANQFK
jgi:hypothetical protein